MFTGILHIHTLAVILFLLLYLAKATLLMMDKKESLVNFSKAVKLPEILISTLFLATGIFLALNSGNLGLWFWVKMGAVITSIPLAIIAFKRMNKPMALLAVMFIVYSYGISETKSPTFEQRDLNAAYRSVAPDKLGQAIYEGQCVGCHGVDGKGGLSGAKDLSMSGLGPDEKIDIIRRGKNAMMPYEGRLSDDHIAAVAAYVETLTGR